MFKKDKDGDFSYTVGDIDEVVDSYKNTAVMLRKVSWKGGPERLELRKWFLDINKEIAGKGVSFLTEDGPGNLINTMLKHGYGDTYQVLDSIKDRDDFDSALASIGKKKPTEENIKSIDDYFDAKTLSDNLV